MSEPTCGFCGHDAREHSYAGVTGTPHDLRLLGDYRGCTRCACSHFIAPDRREVHYADLLATRVQAVRESFDANMRQSPRNEAQLALIATLHMDWILREAERSVENRRAIRRACEIIETADARLLAADGPCGGLPPDMSLAEWRELYVALDGTRTPVAVPDTKLSRWVTLTAVPPGTPPQVVCRDCGKLPGSATHKGNPAHYCTCETRGTP